MLNTAAQSSFPAVYEFHPVILQVKYYAYRYQELVDQKNEITGLMDNIAQSLPEYNVLLSFP